MKRFVHVFAILACLLPACASAQRQIEVPRADGATTPLVVYDPRDVRGCAPLALLSHGAGGSAEHGLAYLGEALARDGWRALAMGHRESGMAPLRQDMRSAGIKQGLSDLVTDTAAYRSRYLDIDAALKWADQQCRAPYKALIGHSMGAITVMFVAGAQNKIDVPAKGGFNAYVALSPEGPGRVFPADAWRTIRAPMLLITGTRDAGLDGEYAWRTRAFDGLPAGCHALAILDGASHMNLGGLDLGNRFKTKTAALVTSYLDGVRGGGCPHLPAEPGVELRSK